MRFELQTLPAQQLVGLSRKMSVADDETRRLFQAFMPHCKSIGPRANPWVYDLRVYSPGLDFTDFGPDTIFTKWAAVAVAARTRPPLGLQSTILPGGLYACFHHRGPAAESIRVFSYIFRRWLPTADYLLDDRPHFETMPDDYDPLSPDAEEQIWIPLKAKPVAR